MNVHVCSRATMAAIVLLLGAAAKLMFAQAPPAAPMTITLSTANVVLDLAVRDRHGKPVLDLRPEEISVTDNGARARLADLHLMNGKQQDEPLVTLFFERPGMRSSRKGSDEDLFGDPPFVAQEASRKLRNAATKFLKKFPGTGLQFAVVDAWGRLQIQQAYTADRKAIFQAVSAAVQPEVYGTTVAASAEEKRLVQIAKTGQASGGSAAGVRERAVARTMYAALQTSSRIARDQHLSLPWACLLALVEAQGALPGRKAIVYFASNETNGGGSSNWLRQDGHARDAVHSIVGAANRAGVNIYVVLPDEVGKTDQLATIFSTAGMSMSTSPSSVDITNGASPLMGDTTRFEMGVMATTQPSAIASQENMNTLARQTGGDVLNASGSMSGGIRDLVQGLTTYYEASFAPPRYLEDGSFHTTAFKTSRRGLKMRSRTGYLALPMSAGIAEPPQPFELPLMAVLKRAELPSDIDYRAAALRMGHQDQGNVGLLALEVPVRELQVREDASTHLNAAHVSVLAAISDGAGATIERFSEDIARRWAVGKGTETTPEFISFERSFSAPPGKYVLETAVIDNNSGKAAARRQSFEISAFQGALELSDLLLVRGIEPATESNGEPDLLWRGDQRVQPNLYGQLPPGTHKLSVFFFAYADPKSQEPATVKLEVLRNGAPLRGEPLTSTLKAGTQLAPVVKSFAIGAAADGDYQVHATLAQDGKSAEANGAFMLSGEEAHIEGGAAGGPPLEVEHPVLTATGQMTSQPSPEDLERILTDARRNALDYGDVLPNLICQQATTRSIDPHSTGNWQLKDKILEVLTYVNHRESRTVMGGEEYNLKKDVKTISELGMISTGEFGAALSNIFTPSSKAVFTWKETGMLRGEPAEVFDYRIEQANSSFSLTVATGSVKIGYHGRVYIDRTTHGVRSLTIMTDDAPAKFPIRRAAVRVDYDYVAINDHDYLLPVSAQTLAGRSGNLLERNRLEFSNFRKFGSTARILGPDSTDGQQ